MIGILYTQLYVRPDDTVLEFAASLSFLPLLPKVAFGEEGSTDGKTPSPPCSSSTILHFVDALFCTIQALFLIFFSLCLPGEGLHKMRPSEAVRSSPSQIILHMKVLTILPYPNPKWSNLAKSNRFTRTVSLVSGFILLINSKFGKQNCLVLADAPVPMEEEEDRSGLNKSERHGRRENAKHHSRGRKVIDSVFANGTPNRLTEITIVVNGESVNLKFSENEDSMQATVQAMGNNV